MKKNCPRCATNFECQVENISECHCSSLSLSFEQQDFISKNYSDCLCNSCLLEIKQAITTKDANHLQKTIYPLRK